MTKTVLITGCSSGIGRTTAHRFLAAGWNVVATMRSLDKWDDPIGNDRLMLTTLDVCQQQTIDRAFREAHARFGHVDCVVNNAGFAFVSVFEATPPDMIADLFDVNVFGPMRVMRSAIPMLRNGGCIVNVTSGSSIVPEPLMALYGSAKFALSGFSEAVRYELGTQGITVRIVEPGMVRETNFANAALSLSATVPIPPSYQAFFDKTVAMYMRETDVKFASEAEVSEAIYQAATEPSGPLRRQVGEDALEFARMRRETSEQSYEALTQDRYAP